MMRPLRYPFIWCAGNIVLVLLPAMALAAILTPAGEPYQTWAHYFRSWARDTLVLAALVAVPVVGLSITFFCRFRVPTSRAWFIAAARLWMLFPLVVGWSIAALVGATFAPGFQGPVMSGPPPAAWNVPLDAVMIIGILALPILAIAVFALAYNSALRRIRADAENRCTTCDYDLTGLHSSTCPECGHEHATWNGERPV